MRFIFVLPAIMAVMALEAPAAQGARAPTSDTAPRFQFRCRWVDPYDSVLNMGLFDPGMAIIAAPASRLDVAVELPQVGDAPPERTINVAMAPQFGRAGGYAANRPATGELTLFMPESGGTFPMILTYRRTPQAPVDTLTFVVIVPKAVQIARGRINGYLVGHYPPPDEGRATPERFVEVTPDLMDVHLSKQFRLRDFVSNSRTEEQRRFYPKYAIIRYSLIQKVEKLVSIIDRSPNYKCKGVRVLSGYRTPDYNRALPEAAYNSYHQYGLAADIIVDSSPSDGQFDDINQDGKVNIHDAANLAQICDYLESVAALDPGGIGLYEYQHSLRGGKHYSTYHIHVDVRPANGKKARWGYGFKDGRKYARLVWKRNEAGKKAGASSQKPEARSQK